MSAGWRSTARRGYNERNMPDNDGTWWPPAAADDERFSLTWRHVRRQPRLLGVYVAHGLAALRRVLLAPWGER